MYTTAQGFSYAALCPDISISPLTYVSLSHSLDSAMVHVLYEKIFCACYAIFLVTPLQSDLFLAAASYQKSSKSKAGSLYPHFTIGPPELQSYSLLLPAEHDVHMRSSTQKS